MHNQTLESKNKAFNLIILQVKTRVFLLNSIILLSLHHLNHLCMINVFAKVMDKTLKGISDVRLNNQKVFFVHQVLGPNILSAFSCCSIKNNNKYPYQQNTCNKLIKLLRDKVFIDTCYIKYLNNCLIKNNLSTYLKTLIIKFCQINF